MRTKLILASLLISILIGGVLYKLRKELQIGSGTFRDHNVLLITIDTLRADHLPAYGYTKIKTPNIDKLAFESLVFEDAVAHTPMTLPSHTSLLTGLLPISHGVRENVGFVLDSRVTTLAEILKNNGYQTAAFISAFVLDSQFGLDQGFDSYSDGFTLAEARIDSTDVYRRAEETEAEVDSWLNQNRDEKFFLWVHYFDPHDPYAPPEPYKTEYASSPYDGEIAYTDHILGNLISRLDQLQLKEKTIIVMTGDHGEGLGEHNERTHSLFVYNATQHVPLLIRLPKGKPHRIKGIVNHIDIAPTILEWLGVAVDPSMQGRSLIPLIQAKETNPRVAYSESIFAQVHYGWSPLRSITTEDYKFIDAPTPELYDRRTDRHETKNLMKEKAAVAGSLHKQLEQIVQSYSQGELKKPQQTDPETEEKLRALGYVGTIVPGTPESRKIDPKDKIDLLETLSKAHRALEQRNYPYVLEATNWVIRQDPNIIDAHFMAASAYLHLNEREKALDQMRKTIALKPDHHQTLYNLGFFHHIEGNFQEAERWYLQLLKYDPAHLRGTLNLASLYRQMNQPQKAEPYISKIIRSYEEARRTTASAEGQSRLLEKMAEIHFNTGNFHQSEKTLREAIQLTPRRPMLHFHLAVIHETREEFDQAEAEYTQESRIDPNGYKAFFNLGVLYRRLNRLEKAISCFQKVLQINKEFYPAYLRLAEAYLAANYNLEEALQLVEAANRQIPSKEGAVLLKTVRKELEAQRR